MIVKKGVGGRAFSQRGLSDGIAAQPPRASFLNITLAVSLIYAKGKRPGQLEADQPRHTIYREILRESIQIVDHPIYRNQCIDADGLRILDSLAANAMAKIPPHPMIAPPPLPKMQRSLDD